MAKKTKAEVNYRDGSPKDCCGYCQNFNGQKGECRVVAGKITPFGISDSYKPHKNPLKGTYDIHPKAAAPAAAVRIGSRRY